MYYSLGSDGKLLMSQGLDCMLAGSFQGAWSTQVYALLGARKVLHPQFSEPRSRIGSCGMVRRRDFITLTTFVILRQSNTETGLQSEIFQQNFLLGKRGLCHQPSSKDSLCLFVFYLPVTQTSSVFSTQYPSSANKGKRMWCSKYHNSELWRFPSFPFLDFTRTYWLL